MVPYMLRKRPSVLLLLCDFQQTKVDLLAEELVENPVKLFRGDELGSWEEHKQNSGKVEAASVFNQDQMEHNGIL